MSWFSPLSFASGHFRIMPGGIVKLDPDMSEDMRIQFWKAWIPYRKQAIENEKKGLFSSRYPILPIEDEDPNKPQYANLDLTEE